MGSGLFTVDVDCMRALCFRFKYTYYEFVWLLSQLHALDHESDQLSDNSYLISVGSGVFAIRGDGMEGSSLPIYMHCEIV
jgi:hypothetical protein